MLSDQINEPRSLRRQDDGSGPALGVMLFEYHTAGIAPILAQAGADFVVVDMEAASATFSDVKTIALAARSWPLSVVVRIPASLPSYVSRALDMGASAVMAPMVEDAKTAESLASALRYPPQGRRGAAFGIAHDSYGFGSTLDRMRTANERNVLIAQIESAAGVDNAEEIAAVDGVDVMWVGHNDLTNSLGIPGELESATFKDAVTRVREAVHRHGKVLGGLATSLSAAKDMADAGYGVLSLMSDVRLLQAAFKEGASTLRS